MKQKFILSLWGRLWFRDLVIARSRNWENPLYQPFFLLQIQEFVDQRLDESATLTLLRFPVRWEDWATIMTVRRELGSCQNRWGTLLELMRNIGRKHMTDFCELRHYLQALGTLAATSRRNSTILLRWNAKVNTSNRDSSFCTSSKINRTKFLLLSTVHGR